MAKAIQIDDNDNVATATSGVGSGKIVVVLSSEGEVISKPNVIGSIPFGHKIALVDFEKGDKVIKYGEVIGVASEKIKVGEWVHTHNVESATVPTSV